MNESSKDFSVRFANGGTSVDENVALDQIEFFAHELELTTYYIDCTKAKSGSAVIRTIAKELDFPEHFDGDLNNLYHCLTDVVLIERRGVAIVLLTHKEQESFLSDTFNNINQIFVDVLAFSRKNERILIYIKQSSEAELL